MEDKQQKFEELRKRAEQLIPDEQREKGDFQVELSSLIHELEVHQIELEMQHKELQSANEALTVQQQEYTELFDFAPVGYVILDKRGRIVTANLTLADMLKTDRVNLEGVVFSRYVQEKYKDTYYLHRQESFESPEAHSLEVKLVTAEGDSFFARLDSSFVPVSEQIRTAVTDITTRRQMEQQLRHSERQLMAAQALTHIGSWEWHLQDNEMSWTDELFRIYGHEPRSFTPTFEKAVASIHPEEQERVRNVVKKGIATGKNFKYTTRLIRADGDMRMVDVYGAVLKNNDDEVYRLWGTVQDVTEQHRTAQAIRHSEARFRTIFEGTDVGIVLLELDGTIIEANPAWCNMTDYEGDAERSLTDFLWESDRVIYHEAVAQVGQPQGAGRPYELRCCNANNEPVWVNLIMSPLRHRDGRMRRIVAMMENIDLRKTVQEELKEVKRRLSRSRENEQLRLAQELHDGPMQDLYAATYKLQALKQTVEGPQQQKLIADTQEVFQIVNERLREVCGELRPPALAPFGLGAAIRSHLERFERLYEDISITREIVDDKQQLPKHLRLTLFRVCQEMLNNIAKHAEATQVLVRFGLADKRILLEIQDNGRGFEVPDRWVDLARAGHLGLVGVSERVKEIDGHLVILSTPGQGTIVRVTAPLKNHPPTNVSS